MNFEYLLNRILGGPQSLSEPLFSFGEEENILLGMEPQIIQHIFLPMHSVLRYSELMFFSSYKISSYRPI